MLSLPLLDLFREQKTNQLDDYKPEYKVSVSLSLVLILF